MHNARSHNLKLAERGIWISIAAYIFLSIGQIAVAELTHSDALRANGFNNVTDILGNIAILIGIRIARIPADSDHVYGHWKVESIASLISSFIMFLVGFEVLRETIMSLISGRHESIEPIGAVAGVASGLIMFVVYLYTRQLAKKTQSQALSASSKDNLTDAVTSISTAVAIVAASFGAIWIDHLMAVIICAFILKTAYEIFRDSVFSLSDGFDDSLLEDCQQAVEQQEKVKKVKLLRGRTYGSNIFLDVVVEMSPDLSVFESHAATEEIEKILIEGFGVYDVDVHVEPAALPEEEHFASRSLELLAKEEKVLNAEELDKLLVQDFQEILADGKKASTIAKESQPLAISHYESQQISKKTFLLKYEYSENGKTYAVSSLWRRNETWFCLFRQLTEKKS